MLFLILIIYSSNKFMKGLTYNLNTVAWTTYLHGAKKDHLHETTIDLLNKSMTFNLK